METQKNPWSAPGCLRIKSQNLGNAHVAGVLTDKQIEKYILRGCYGETKRLELLAAKAKPKAKRVKKATAKVETQEELLDFLNS